MLSRYDTGLLDEESAAHISSHLDGCTQCETALSEISSTNNALAAAVKHASTNSASQANHVEEPALKSALNALRNLPNRPAKPNKKPNDKSSALKPGTRLGDYVVRRLIGKGGMAEVYLAEHTQLRRPVAIKLLPEAMADNPKAIARLRREMMAVGQLDHENVVRASDAGKFNQMHYLVMDYVKGNDLAKLSKQTGPMRVADASEIIRQVAVGLAYVHQHGIIHRDIKPSNLMMTRDGVVKILDLGLVRWQNSNGPDEEQLTHSNQLVGTMDYMSAEQGRGDTDIDHRTDIYSLGATFYRLLAGHSPFEHKRSSTPWERIYSIVHEQPIPLNEIRQDVPKTIIKLINKMMSKEPSGRPDSAEHVAAILEPFASESNLSSLTESKPESLSHVSTQTLTPQGAQRPKIPDRRAVQSESPKLSGKTKAIAALGILGMLVVAWFGITPEPVDDPQQENSKASSKMHRGPSKSTPANQTIIAKAKQPKRQEKSISPQPQVVPASPQPFELKQFKTFDVKPWKFGRVAGELSGLVPNPRRINGMGRWQIFTRLPSFAVSQVTVSPDGQLLACLSRRGDIYVYTMSNMELHTILIGYGPGTIAWSPDSQTIVACHDSGVRFWTRAGAPIMEIPIGGCKACDWNHDGSQLALTHKEYLAFVDVKTGIVNKIDYPSGTPWPETISWNSKQPLILTGHYDGKVLLWDLKNQTSKPIPLPETFKSPMLVTWRPDGQSFVTAGNQRGDATVLLWNAEGTKHEVVTSGSSTDTVGSLVWSPDGEHLAIGFADAHVAVHVCNIDTFEETILSPSTTGTHLYGGTHSVTWSGDSEQLFVATTRNIRRISRDGANIDDLKLPSAHPFQGLDWNHDGNQIAAAGIDGRIRTWRADGRPEQVWHGHDEEISALAWHPTQDKILTGDVAGNGKLWSLDKKTGASFGSSNGRMHQAEWNSTGDRLAILHVSQCVAVYQDDGSKVPMPGPEDSRDHCFSWSPDGQQLATLRNDQLLIWNATNWTSKVIDENVPQLEHLAWSPDGNTLVADGRRMAGGFKSWSLGDKKYEPQFGQSGAYASHGIAWSPDERRLATMYLNGDITIFDNGVPGVRLDGIHGKGLTVPTGPMAWSPREQLATSAESLAIKVWKFNPSQVEWEALLLADGETAVMDRQGKLLWVTPKAEEQIVYVAETSDGRLDLRSPSEFRDITEMPAPEVVQDFAKEFSTN